MKNMWVENPEYIVNLTRNELGNSWLEKIVFNDILDNPSPVHVFDYVRARIWSKVQIMNEATLGRIAAYASAYGAHSEKHPRGTLRPKFINATGINHVWRPIIESNKLPSMGPGDFLQEIVMTVITCVVFDLMTQSELQAQWDSDVMTESEEKYYKRFGWRKEAAEYKRIYPLGRGSLPNDV